VRRYTSRTIRIEQAGSIRGILKIGSKYLGNAPERRSTIELRALLSELG
jgi:hypothetical protein